MAYDRTTRLVGIRIGMITVEGPRVRRTAVDVRRYQNDELVLRYTDELGGDVQQHAVIRGFPPAFCSEEDGATVAAVESWLLSSQEIGVVSVEMPPDRS